VFTQEVHNKTQSLGNNTTWDIRPESVGGVIAMARRRRWRRTTTA
jgi:hypothetical protein